MGNFISWTSEEGLNNRDSTFMPEFGKDVSYSGPGGTSFGRNTEAFSNSVISQALDNAQRAEAKKAERQADFERISNPETYESTEAPESFHLGEIVGADTIDEKWDPEKWKDPDKYKQLIKEINTFTKEHGDINTLSKEESYELGKMYEVAGALSADKYSAKKKDIEDTPYKGVQNAINSEIDSASRLLADNYSKLSKRLLDRAHDMDKADEEKAKENIGSSAPTSGSRFTADMKGESKAEY